MKKQLLLAIALMTVAGVGAQNRQYQLPQSKVLVPKSNAGYLKALPVERSKGDVFEIPFVDPGTRSTVAANKVALTESLIGYTQYDLQTNSAILNRFIKHDDGTMSAAWTFLCTGCASGTDRGTGYNYFDGSSWGPIPAVRIEPTIRSGFPSIAVTTSGKEMSITHTGGGMLITGRPAKGTGAWTEYPNLLGSTTSDTWCKAIAGGANGESIHTIWNANTAANGQVYSIYYSRSDDGGMTWPVLRTVIPNLDSSHYLGWGGDAYAMDSKGDEIAIVTGDFTNDQILLKSMDNGATWSTTVVSAFPIPFYDDATMQLPDIDGDGVSDDIEAPSGDAHVLIDNNGLCHVWFTTVLITDTSAADLLGYYPNASDGLFYWNENFGTNPPVIIAGIEDLNGDGVISIPTGGANNGNGMGVYRGGATQMPTAGVDASNYLYVSYQTYDELSDTTIYPGVGHKHVYVIKSVDGGTTWSIPYDVVPGAPADGLLQDGVFACMAKKVDANVHLIYQRDYAPGHSLSSNTTEAGWNADPSDIVYASIPVTDLILGVNDNIKSNDFTVGQNIPNPATETTSINFTLDKSADVDFTVTDVVGKVVYSEVRGTVNPGTYTINLNTANMNSGVYFYTVKVGDSSVTKKMIVN